MTATLTTSHAPSVRVCTPEARVTKSLLGYGVLAGPCYVTVSLAQALAHKGFDLTRHDWSLLAAGAWGWIQSRSNCSRRRPGDPCDASPSPVTRVRERSLAAADLIPWLDELAHGARPAAYVLLCSCSMLSDALMISCHRANDGHSRSRHGAPRPAADEGEGCVLQASPE